MILAVLALVAATAQPYGHATSRELTESFAAMCLRDDASLETLPAKAAAAGFRTVAVIPSQLENREVGAWRRGGLRLSATAGSQNSTWKLNPMCAVTAEIGRVPSDKEILHIVGPPLQILMSNWHSSPKGSMYHLVSEKGIIDLSLNKQDRSHTVMSLFWQVGQASPTAAH